MKKLLIAALAVSMVSSVAHAGSVNFYGQYDSGNSATTRWTNTTASTTGSNELKGDSGFGIGIEYETPIHEEFGVIVGGNYAFDRTVNTSDSKSAGVTTTTTYVSAKPKLGMSQLYGNLTYKIEQFYLLGGLNLSLPSYSRGNAANGNGDEKVSGSLGYQVGVGAHFAENFSAELLFQQVNFSYSSAIDTAAGISYSGFTTNSVVLRGKYNLPI